MTFKIRKILGRMSVFLVFLILMLSIFPAVQSSVSSQDWFPDNQKGHPTYARTSGVMATFHSDTGYWNMKNGLIELQIRSKGRTPYFMNWNETQQNYTYVMQVPATTGSVHNGSGWDPVSLGASYSNVTFIGDEDKLTMSVKSDTDEAWIGDFYINYTMYRGKKYIKLEQTLVNGGGTHDQCSFELQFKVDGIDEFNATYTDLTEPFYYDDLAHQAAMDNPFYIWYYNTTNFSSGEYNAFQVMFEDQFGIKGVSSSDVMFSWKYIAPFGPTAVVSRTCWINVINYSASDGNSNYIPDEIETVGLPLALEMMAEISDVSKNNGTSVRIDYDFSDVSFTTWGAGQLTNMTSGNNTCYAPNYLTDYNGTLWGTNCRNERKVTTANPSLYVIFTNNTPVLSTEWTNMGIDDWGGWGTGTRGYENQNYFIALNSRGRGLVFGSVSPGNSNGIAVLYDKSTGMNYAGSTGTLCELEFAYYANFSESNKHSVYGTRQSFDGSWVESSTNFIDWIWHANFSEYSIRFWFRFLNGDPDGLSWIYEVNVTSIGVQNCSLQMGGIGFPDNATIDWIWSDDDGKYQDEEIRDGTHYSWNVTNYIAWGLDGHYSGVNRWNASPNTHLFRDLGPIYGSKTFTHYSNPGNQNGLEDGELFRTREYFSIVDNGNETDAIERMLDDFKPISGFSYTNPGGNIRFFQDSSSEEYEPITNWNWDFGDGGTSNAQNPSHTYSSYGTFYVSLTVTDEYGATNTTGEWITLPLKMLPEERSRSIIDFVILSFIFEALIAIGSLAYLGKSGRR